ncbi:hypothetical protein [Streptomyces gobiensis]|uniref:hypothetical protein n=1 Tax=Streptomyces gobiensis TaxID=2875706 RepID=UPI001E338CF5|nr:hypothetical protein [Streptomyces gobiensis]UGY93141.1 hypothetical protein test1122_16430 [Streptomyces gobiensis]
MSTGRPCARCQQLTDRPVRVREIHSATGPGYNLWACPGCAPHYPPGPDALVDVRWKEYLDHVALCRRCLGNGDHCPRAVARHAAWKAARVATREGSR